MLEKIKCPLCSTEIQKWERYPNAVCFDCSKRAVSEDGRPLIFSNVDMTGGFMAFYADTDEVYNSHICYIDGIKCFANEHRFGGIVVEVIK